MKIEEIRDLIRLAQESGVAELEVRFGDDSVRITLGGVRHSEVASPAVHAVPAGLPPAPGQLHAPPPPPPDEGQQTLVVKSPIVGTYYDAPGEDEPPFVKVGDQVHPKQVLCIIESMKLMNEIEAEVAGTVVAKLIENGRPVEYGESLFTIRPL